MARGRHGTPFPFVHSRRRERASDGLGAGSHGRLSPRAYHRRDSTLGLDAAPNSTMSQKSQTRDPMQPPPVWPPKSDARYDPVVFDTERRLMLSVDDAAAALNGIAAVSRQDEV